MIQEKELLIEEGSFSSRIIHVTKRMAFSLVYKGIDVEGTAVEYFSDLYSNYDMNIEIENNEDLSDDDLAFLQDYIEENIQG